MMKRNLFAMALTGLCAFGFVACGDDDKKEEKTDDNVVKCSTENPCTDEGKVCSDEGKCVDDTSGNGGNDEADDACKGKEAGAACGEDGENKVCSADGKCVDDASGNGGNDEADDACKGKEAGDACGEDGENKVCSEDGKCEEVLASGDCNTNDDCSGEYSLCDLDLKKCYKLDSTYEPYCGNTDDSKQIYYYEERIFADDSIEDKAVGKVCDGDTPVCSIADAGCVSDEDSEECNEIMSCADSSKVCVNKKCVDPEPSNIECDNTGTNNCTGDKLCLAGKCISVAIGDSCDVATFKYVCSATRTILVCEAGKVTEKTCNGGMTCNDRPDGAAECTDSCGNSDSVGTINYADCDNGTNEAYNYICGPDFYGNGLYAFETITACGDKVCSAPSNHESGIEAVCE